MMLARSILFIVFQAWSASCKDVVSHLFPVDQLFFKLAILLPRRMLAHSVMLSQLKKIWNEQDVSIDEMKITLSFL
jgi:hypothetical protein